MKLLASRIAGIEVLKAAGLTTERCLGFTVEFEPNSLVVINARYAVDELTIEAVKRAVALDPVNQTPAPEQATKP